MTEVDPHKPAWAHPNNQGTPKVCQRCQTEFKDYTARQTHNICVACWKINYFKNTNLRNRPNKITSKREKDDPRICPHCDGAGCLDCDRGVADLEPEKELELGRP